MKTPVILLTLLLLPGPTLFTQEEKTLPATPLTLLEGSSGIPTDPPTGTGPQPAQDTLRKGVDIPPPDFVQVDKEPVVKKRTEPHYPEVAMKAGIEGKVWVKLWINTEGKVQSAQILKSENVVLNDAALESARQWEFEPATIKGKPAAVWVSVPFMFKLADKKPDEPAGGSSQSMTATVLNILAGKPPANAGSIVDPQARFINGSQSHQLLPALGKHGEKSGFPNEGERSAAILQQYRAGGAPNLFAVVVRTDRKGEPPHFHTVLWQKPSEGDWKIVLWQTSR